MALNWLRDEKNQRLLAWITAAAIGSWTLFVYFNPSAPSEAATPANVGHGAAQATAIDSIRGQAVVNIQQKQSTPAPTDTSPARGAAQETRIGVIGETANVTIGQEQQ